MPRRLVIPGADGIIRRAVRAANNVRRAVVSTCKDLCCGPCNHYWLATPCFDYTADPGFCPNQPISDLWFHCQVQTQDDPNGPFRQIQPGDVLKLATSLCYVITDNRHTDPAGARIDAPAVYEKKACNDPECTVANDVFAVYKPCAPDSPYEEIWVCLHLFPGGGVRAFFWNTDQSPSILCACFVGFRNGPPPLGPSGIRLAAYPIIDSPPFGFVSVAPWRFPSCCECRGQYSHEVVTIDTLPPNWQSFWPLGSHDGGCGDLKVWSICPRPLNPEPGDPGFGGPNPNGDPPYFKICCGTFETDPIVCFEGSYEEFSAVFDGSGNVIGFNHYRERLEGCASVRSTGLAGPITGRFIEDHPIFGHNEGTFSRTLEVNLCAFTAFPITNHPQGRHWPYFWCPRINGEPIEGMTGWTEDRTPTTYSATWSGDTGFATGSGSMTARLMSPMVAEDGCWNDGSCGGAIPGSPVTPPDSGRPGDLGSGLGGFL